MSNELERELGWDEEIEKDGNDFVLLVEGDYDFEVESFERGRHSGSQKLPPCNKAILKIRIESESGNAIVTHNLFLHTITEGMISQFFTSIGQKKKGEKVKMNWHAAIGARGRCKVGVRSYTPEGQTEAKKYNEIKRFYPMEEKQFREGEF